MHQENRFQGQSLPAADETFVASDAFCANGREPLEWERDLVFQFQSDDGKIVRFVLGRGCGRVLSELLGQQGADEKFRALLEDE